MNTTNQVIIKKADFDCDYLEVAAQQIKLLLKAGNVLVAYNDVATNQVTISFLPLFGNAPKPYWLLPDEVEAAQEVHAENELNYHKFCASVADSADEIVDAVDDVINKNSGGNKGGHFDA